MGRRVVLDTNVVVSGIRSQRGAAHQVLRRVGSGQFVHVLSVALLFEYEAVLKSPSTGVRLPAQRIEEILDYLCAAGVRQLIHFLWRPTLPDPNDDLVLEVAVSGRCDTIVTFNVRDFAGSGRFGVSIQTPQQFLRSLEVAS